MCVQLYAMEHIRRHRKEVLISPIGVFNLSHLDSPIFTMPQTFLLLNGSQIKQKIL